MGMRPLLSLARRQGTHGGCALRRVLLMDDARPRPASGGNNACKRAATVTTFRTRCSCGKDPDPPEGRVPVCHRAGRVSRSHELVTKLAFRECILQERGARHDDLHLLSWKDGSAGIGATGSQRESSSGPPCRCPRPSPGQTAPHTSSTVTGLAHTSPEAARTAGGG